jgi:hypothetical protein
MSHPTVYLVKPEHVGSTDINMFLYSVLAKEFGDNFEVVNESTSDRLLPNAKGMRKVKSYGIKARGTNHSIHFDITEVSTASSINWMGNHK